jgi:CheY-like chemotaxis protein/HPt (histidine-containing phosphotransfer) domain-containing protein
MSRPRLLLIEDDAAIRRFVTLALEDHDLELVEAPTLAAAVQALQDGRFDVVLCDLMLPDGSGLDLLRELAAPDAPSAGACRVAFSAGVSAAVRQQLQQIGVNRVLGKPVSLAELSACVAGAVAQAVASTATERTAQSAPGVASGAPVPAPATRQQAIAEYFGGDANLYAAFSAQCAQQFAHDAAAGDRAMADGDLAALRRLAHSLKSVLLTLGHGSDSACAARLETCAANGQTDTSAVLWDSLAPRLRALAA